MPCWVVPSVASEIWRVPVDEIMSAIKSGRLTTKQESGFTFVDVAPHAQHADPGPKRPAPKPITYKVVRQAGPKDSYSIPRAAEVITPAEMAGLTADAPDATDDATDSAGQAAGAMGDWRRGRRSATTRRNPPNLHIA